MDLVFLGNPSSAFLLWRASIVSPKNPVRRVEATKNRLRRFIPGLDLEAFLLKHPSLASEFAVDPAVVVAIDCPVFGVVDMISVNLVWKNSQSKTRVGSWFSWEVPSSAFLLWNPFGESIGLSGSIPKNPVRRVEATKNRLRRFILGSISRHSCQNPLNTLL